LTAAQVIAIAEETKPARIRTVLQPSKETSTPPMINVALKPRLRRIGVILFAPPAVGAAFWGFLHLTGNFNAVVPGEFYRSAQLTPAQLSEYVGVCKLRTVINLRGDNKGQPWYDAEVKESDHLGIVHVDFGMSARHELTRAQAIALIALMEKAAKPLLVHCKDGADRAGLASARDFLAAKKRADNEGFLPASPKIVVTGGLDFNDHRLIWDRLDKVRAKHPDMVLLHGGSPKGDELIAAKWATNRKAPQIALKPDWTKHAKAAPFKRNDAMLDVLPIDVMVFPGTLASRTTSPTRPASSAFRSGGCGASRV
jgi:protein tyrosine phosphatase (PTP) superfamily phosphohydrolase (DUF442 family)